MTENKMLRQAAIRNSGDDHTIEKLEQCILVPKFYVDRNEFPPRYPRVIYEDNI